MTSFVDGTTFLVMTFRIPAVAASQYVRLRGTNMPPAVPFETDANGNPLADVYTNANDTTRLRIPCTTAHSASSQFDGCPDHLATATGAEQPDRGPEGGLVRRRGLVGPLVLRQPDLHRGRGLDAGRRRAVSRNAVAEL